jgi:pilus assembly protein Flp/PilA
VNGRCRGRISHIVIARQGGAPEEVMTVVNRLRSFVRADEGQDLIEYAMLVALIALIAVVAVTDAGDKVKGVFEQVTAKIPG